MVRKSGIFDDKKKLLSDVSEAFEINLYCDITLALADGKSISTSKFMLACRVPYFDKLLFGGNTEYLEDGSSVSLNCCDSKVFHHILKYVLVGVTSFLDMSLLSLLNLCIGSLVDGILDNLEDFLVDMEVKVEECLVGLQFAVDNMLPRVSELFDIFIRKERAYDKLLKEMMTLICSFLPPADLWTAVLVCRKWRDLGEHPSLWTWSQVRVSNMDDLEKLVSTNRLEKIQKIDIHAWDMSTEGGQFIITITTQPQLLKCLPKLKILGLHSKDLRPVDPGMLAVFVCDRENISLTSSRFTQVQAIFSNVAEHRDLKLSKMVLQNYEVVNVDPFLLSGALARLVEVKLRKLTDEQADVLFTTLSEGSKVKILDVVVFNCNVIGEHIFAKAVNVLEKFQSILCFLTRRQTQALLADMSRGSLLEQLRVGSVDASGVSPVVFSSAVNKLEVLVFSCTTEQVEKLFQVMAKKTTLKILELADTNLTTLDPQVLAIGINRLERVQLINCELNVSEQRGAVMEYLVEQGTQLEVLFVWPSIKPELPAKLVTRAQEALSELKV